MRCDPIISQAMAPCRGSYDDRQAKARAIRLLGAAQPDERRAAKNPTDYSALVTRSSPATNIIAALLPRNEGQDFIAASWPSSR